MSFRYEQATGNFYHGDDLLVSGYSGHGAGLNNPAMQNVHAVGPIPQGKYTISTPHVSEKVGPIAMNLTPFPDNEMFGRGDFLIHGDNHQMNRTASDGCIIVPAINRIQIAQFVMNGDNILEVTP